MKKHVCLIALLAGLLLSPPAYATSASAGLAPDEDGESLPVGRLPDRETTSGTIPIAPPAFRLTPPAEPDVGDVGVFKPETFTLPNGLAVVVIPNRRAPIVSHMVWYQVGAADEPQGKSGLAHLLEHLMFKGTPKVSDGAFSRTVAANGGNDNAFTSWDYTAYFQNIARDRLELVMEMEADRMANLLLSDAQVSSERDVVAAERQQVTDNEPLGRLREAMRAALFVHHPYGRPIIGWENEIKLLTREDALAFYRTWYSPANVIVVVSGDVSAEEIKPIAEKTYGQLPARATPNRKRLAEPRLDAERRVVVRDAGVLQPQLMRSYLAPSYRTGDRTQVVPLQVLSEILGGGATSRLYRRMVLDLRVATGVRFDYDPLAFDLSTADIAVTPAPGRDLGLVETALDATLKDLLGNGLSEAELSRAKKRLVDGAVFARDSVMAPAYLFGMTLAAGGDISDIEQWPQRVMAVSVDDVMKAAQQLFGQRGYVTGILQPDPQAPQVAPSAAGEAADLAPAPQEVSAPAVATPAETTPAETTGASATSEAPTEVPQLLPAPEDEQ
jgi:zinc protease